MNKTILMLIIAFMPSLAHASLGLHCPPRYVADMRRETVRWWPEGPNHTWLCAQAYQESGWNDHATSSVGAAGLLQFMPATWHQAQVALHLGLVPPTAATPAIAAGAWYMGTLKHMFRRDRGVLDGHDLALASYNAGPGTILKAQEKCHEARLWGDIIACLPAVSGASNARQTSDYVSHIHHWQGILQ